MKRRELLRHLNRQGCVLRREGGNHSWRLNPLKNKRSAVPRHSEIRDLWFVRSVKTSIFRRPELDSRESMISAPVSGIFPRQALSWERVKFGKRVVKPHFLVSRSPVRCEVDYYQNPGCGRLGDGPKLGYSGRQQPA